MAKKRGRKAKTQEAIEAKQQLEIDPLAAAERQLSLLSNACDAAMVRVNKAASDEALTRELLKAGECFRKHYAFGNELFQVTGQGVYKPRWQFAQRLNEYQRRRWLGLKHGLTLPVAVELPGLNILKALKETVPPKAEPIFAVDDYPQVEARNYSGID